MDKHFSHILDIGKRDAALRFRVLMNELAFLVSSFPHLRDSFDADELPVSFIMKRDSRRAQARAVRRKKPAPAAVKKAAGRRPKHGS